MAAGSSRRGQSPTPSSLSARRNNASGSASSTLTSGKAETSSPNHCPMRQQYAVRAAELPKIKGVFIGKKHTCWVAQWNDANGQPRQSCFNIKQHGFEKARRLAVQARQTLMGMSTTKKPNFLPTEAERMATNSVSAPPAAREAATIATRLPDLMLMPDPTTAIAEAFGSRSVQTPTAILPPQAVKAKLEGFAAVADVPRMQGCTKVAGAPVSDSVSSSLSPPQTSLNASGVETLRNASQDSLQRPEVSGLQPPLSVPRFAHQVAAQLPLTGNSSTALASLTPGGGPCKKQHLSQHQLQQQLEDQLQKLQQLQQQFLQQSHAALHPPSGASSSFSDTSVRGPGASSNLGFLDGSQSALALVKSLLGSSAMPSGGHRSPASEKHLHVDRQGPSAALPALRAAEGHQQQAAAAGVVELPSKPQMSTQCFKMPHSGLGTPAIPDDGDGTPGAPRSSADTVNGDGMQTYSKRKHGLIYLHKQGKRTLASLAREFPSVGGVTYNVKCACWEVAVKGRETAKVFSTRKFGGLEAAYGAAVMWKRRVERGEAGPDDADGPEGHEDDGEDVEEGEGPSYDFSVANWEGGAESGSSSRKRAACSSPEVARSVFGVEGVVQPQQARPTFARPLTRVAPNLDGNDSPFQQLLSRASSL